TWFCLFQCADIGETSLTSCQRAELNKKLLKTIERIRQAERSGDFALSEALRDIIAEEQDHEIDLRDALGLR
nr:ferritin-like domain-containing protein [Thermoproteota archaeon]